MAKLTFDNTGERLYHTGVSECALFVMSDQGAYQKGVAWNGISNATVTPEGGDANDVYADNMKYLSIPGAVNVNASITAYDYPYEFNACMGLRSVEGAKALLFAQQKRAKFGYVYKSKIGSDTNDDYGFTLDILYNCLASPSELSSDTVNETVEAGELSFDISTTPVAGSDLPTNKGMKPTAWLHIECKPDPNTEVGSLSPDYLLNNDGTPKSNLTALLEALYGTANTEPRLPLPSEVYTLLYP